MLQEDALFEVLFLIPPRPIRVDQASDGPSDFDDFGSVDDDGDWGANPGF